MLLAATVIIMENPIEDNILSLLKQQKKDYLSLSQIRARLPVSLLRAFRIGKSSGDMLKAIMPFLGNKLKQHKSGRSYYISLNISDEEMMMNAIRRRPGLSSKILCKSLPIPKKELMLVLNSMLDSGVVKCNINETHGISLRLRDEQTLSPQSSSLSSIPAFKAAYDKIGKGRGFVRIHQIREELGWSVREFDDLLKKLMADYTVELHCGDPSLLNERQIKDSFTDDNGVLYITLTWWGKQ